MWSGCLLPPFDHCLRVGLSVCLTKSNAHSLLHTPWISGAVYTRILAGAGEGGRRPSGGRLVEVGEFLGRVRSGGGLGDVRLGDLRRPVSGPRGTVLGLSVFACLLLQIRL